MKATLLNNETQMHKRININFSGHSHSSETWAEGTAGGAEGKAVPVMIAFNIG